MIFHNPLISEYYLISDPCSRALFEMVIVAVGPQKPVTGRPLEVNGKEVRAVGGAVRTLHTINIISQRHYFVLVVSAPTSLISLDYIVNAFCFLSRHKPKT